MKNSQKTPKTSNKTLTHQPKTNHANTKDSELLTSSEGLSIVCSGCYLENAIKSTLDVLKTAGDLAFKKSNNDAVLEGINIAEHTLEEVLEEVRSKPHGKVLANATIPVRPLPFVGAPPQ